MIFRKLLVPAFAIFGILVSGQAAAQMMPDMFGRPWAEIWERYHEEGMEPPEDDVDIFSFE